jgi:large subunit ribosomal protein L10
VENPRPEKVAVVDEVRERLENAEATVLTEYRGLNVPAMARLRDELRAAGGEVKIYKNTLVRFAARDLGLEIDDLLTGPTAIAFAPKGADGTPGDAVAIAKAVRRYAGENEALVIKGGLLGTTRLSTDEVKALADVAPREQLLSEIAGLFAAPMQQFAGLLDAVPRGFVYALNALIEKQGGAPAEDATDTAADAAPTDTAADAASTDTAADAASTDTAADAASTDTAADAASTDTAADAAAES